MTCQCICNCSQPADESKLCAACELCFKLSAEDKPRHRLPDVPTVWPKLEPIVPISRDKIDAAIDKAMDGLI